MKSTRHGIYAPNGALLGTSVRLNSNHCRGFIAAALNTEWPELRRRGYRCRPLIWGPRAKHG